MSGAGALAGTRAVRLAGIRCPEGRLGSVNSVMVPHAPQAGHRPFHLGEACPQSRQRNVVLVPVFRMMGASSDNPW